ncbi:YDG domain-containing protein [Psychromonas ingrahamii]|nr:YDG domain-containing protein [Psychromonas ingrahamii]
MKCWVAVAADTQERGKANTRERGKGNNKKLIAVALSLPGFAVIAAPQNGQVLTGSAGITQSGTTTVISQNSQNLSLNWDSFNVSSSETVNFEQPGASSLAVNHIIDTNGSQILGSINANGQVFLINPNGVLFGEGAQVNVGGLVASTLDTNDANIDGNVRSFSGDGDGAIVNQGTINAADGGYVALLGNSVSNQGTITAPLGSVGLAAGNSAILTFKDNHLTSIEIDQSMLDSLAKNGGLIQADGGRVLLTAGAKATLQESLVSNTGVIQARTVENLPGNITILGGMAAGTADIDGTLDASAPDGGDGGYIDTSAAHVHIADDAKVTTQSAKGKIGTWLIDPTDFTISSGSTVKTDSGIGADTLTTNLGSNNVIIETVSVDSGTEAGDINVDAEVEWSANKLTLKAHNDININAVITASGTSSLDLQSDSDGNNSGKVNVGLDSSGFSGRVDFSDTVGTITTPRTGTGLLTIDGNPYTVIGSTADVISSTGHYALGSNIDGSTAMTITSFGGSFDGLGHSISNGNGLFPEIQGATISNLGLIGSQVTGGAGTGALAGSVASTTISTISNVYSTQNVNTAAAAADTGGLVGSVAGAGAINISNSYTTGDVTGKAGTGGLVGSIAGTNASIISNSYATGKVDGDAGTGGLVGSIAGIGGCEISNSYATGTTVKGNAGTGGLVGSIAGAASGNASNISFSYATGNVAGDAASGGLVGSIAGDDTGAPSNISDSYATGNVNATPAAGGSGAGGLVGSLAVNSGNISNSYATGDVTNTGSATGGLVGSTSASGTIANSCASGDVLGDGAAAGGLVGSSAGSEAIINTYATGNVESVGAGTGGLIGSNTSGIIMASFASGKVNGGGAGTGGLAGSNTSGAISQSFSVSNVTGAARSIAEHVTADNNSTPLIYNATATNGASVGGLVGSNAGLLANTYAAGDVIGYAAGIGGLVGDNQTGGTIAATSYSSGTVTDKDGIVTNAARATIEEGGTIDTSGDIWKTVTGGNPVLANIDKTLTLSTTSFTKTYDGSAYSGTTALSSSCCVDIMTASFPTTDVNAGDYTITPLLTLTNTALSSYFTVADVALTITQAPLALSTNNITKTYDGLKTASSTAIISSGTLFADDALTGGTFAFTDKNAGSGNKTVSTSGVTVGDGTHNDNYNVSYIKNTTSTIDKAALTVTADNQSRTYGAVNPALTSSLTGFVNGETDSVLTGAGSATTSADATTGAGTATITAGVGSLASSNYDFSSVNGILTIDKAALTVTADNQSRTYGAVNPALTSSLTGFVNGETDSVLTGAGSATTTADATTGAGTATITAGVGSLASSNYDFSSVDGILTIDKAALTVTADNQSRTYGAVNPALTSSLTGFVNGETDSVLTGAGSATTTADATTGAGTATITAGVGSLASSNYDFSSVNGILTIDKAALTVTADNQSRTYGAVNPALTSSLTGFVNGETDSVLTGAGSATTTADATTGAGTATITAGVGSLASSNYDFSSVNGILTIDKAALTVTADNQSRTYGAVNPALTSSLTGFVNGETDSVLTGAGSATTTADATTGAGTATITAGVGSLASSNYDFSSVNGILTIDKAALTVTADNQSRTYGAVNPALTSSLTGFVNGETDSVLTGAGSATTTADATTGAGTATITAGVGSLASSNYDFSSVNGILTIDKAALTVTADNQSRTYGAVNPALTSSLTGFVNGETDSVLTGAGSATTTADATTGAGTATITAGVGSLASSNYDFSSVDGILTIDKAALTVTADNQSRTYGAVNPALTSSLTGFVNGETDSVLTGAGSATTTADATTGAGTATITAGVGSLASSNYDFSSVNGILTIDKAALTVTADNQSRTYGAVNPALTSSLTGFVNGETDSVLTGAGSATTTADATTGAGTATITAGVGSLASSNYDFSSVDGILTIDKAALTVTADNQSRTYGAVNPALTSSLTGFVNGETDSVLTGAGSATTTADATTGAGTATITAGVGSLASSNYDFSSVDGILTIDKAALTVTADNQSRTYGAVNPALTSSLTGFVNGETDSVLTGAGSATTTTADATTGAGTATITAGVGSLASSNYDFSSVDGILTIDKADLTLNGTRIYDGTNGVTGSVLTATGVNGETFAVNGTGATGNLASKDVQSATGLVNLDGLDLGNGVDGGLSTNYNALSIADSAVSITQADLTLGANNISKTYDGSLTASGTAAVTSGTLFTGDTLTGGTFAFTDKNVGSGDKTVTVSGVTVSDGTNAGNYNLSYADNVTSTINQAALTLGANNISKTYDGSLTASGTAAVTSGTLFTGDTLTGGTFAFTDKNVGSGNKTVTTSGVTVSDGTNASNYSVSYADNTASTITAKALTATVAAPNKIYDGNSTAAPTLSITTGLVGAETLGVNGTASFNSKNVANANLVTVDTTTLTNGSNGGLAGNYSLASGQTVAASITAKALTATVAAPNKIYNGNGTAAPTLSITAGLVGAETLGVNGTASFNSNNVADANLVTIDTTTLTNGSNGGLAGNYSLVGGQTVAASITAKVLTATVAAPSKIYDGNGTAAPTLSITAGLVGAETLGVNGTASFNSNNVADANLVTVDTTALTNGSNGGLAGNYSLVSGQTVAASITAKALTATVAAPSKIYDGNGTAAPTLSITAGLVGAETLGVNGTASFNSNNVADANLVTVDTTTLTNGDNGGLAGNYSLVGGQTVAASITAKALTATVAAPSKIYDGNGTATPTLSITAGLVGAETLGVNGTASFNSNNVADANLVTVDTTALTNGSNGGLAGNYSLVSGQTVAASITAKALTATVAAPSKIYDGNGTAAPTLSITAGLVGAETLGVNGTASFNSNNVADANLVTIDTTTLTDGSNGGLAGNYSLVSGQTVAASITAKALTATVAAPSKIYDGNGTAAPTLSITAGLVGAETLGVNGTASFNSNNVADANLVTVDTTTLTNGDNGGLAGNYSLVGGQTVAASITAKALTATVAAPSKIYDGNGTAAPTLSITAGLVGAETLGVNGTASFNSKNVADANLVTVDTTTLTNGDNGGLAGNYSLVGGQTVAASITAKALTATVATPSKIYDGNGTATPTLSITAGLVGAETLGVNGTASFNSKKVADANLITVDTTALTNGSNGGLAGNYSLVSGQTVAASITAKALTATVAAPSKIYDGNGTAAPTLSITAGLVGAETLGVNGTASFNSNNVADANLVTIDTTTLTNGSNGGLAGNYSLASGQAVAANITAKDVTVNATANNKTYDGNTTAALTDITFNGLIGTEALDLSGQFSDQNAAANKGVTVAGVDTTTGLASNYNITNPTGLTADITAKDVTVNATANNKTYDGDNVAALTNITFNGLIGSEALDLSGQFSDQNAAANKGVTVTGVDTTTGLASNYNITNPTGLVADITAKDLTVNATANNKTYDGNTVAALTDITFSGLIGTEALDLSGQFSDQNAAANKGVTVAGVDTTNGLASNYNITSPTGLTADITAKDVTVNATANNKTYDGDAVAALTNITFNGLIGSEALDLSGQFSDQNAATNKGVTVAGVDTTTGLASNYNITNPTGLTADITAKDVTVNATANNKTYDGDNVAALTNITFNGLIGSEALDLSGQFSDQNAAANKGVTVAGFDTTTGLASNYNITNPTGLTADITAKDVTVNATANNKTYDGNTTAALTDITFNGLIGSEALDLSGQFSGQNVAANKGVTVAGVDTTTGLASNYNITNPTSLVADITAKDVTVNATANNKIYDGDNVAALSNITFNGLIGSEALDLSGQFSDQNAAANKGVTVAGVDTTTGLASNYNITNPTGLVADITAKDVTVNATANNKTYDGDAVAALTNITFNGLIGSEALDLSGQFSDQNAATNKGVTVAGVDTTTGLASNYNITNPSGLVADITAKDVTVNATANNKTYDGNTVAALTNITFNGLIGSEALDLSGQFSDQNAATNKVVTVTGVDTTTGLASNYNITNPTGLTADITTKDVTVNATANNKTYDGNTVAALTNITFNGLIGSEALDLSGQFDDQNAAANKGVTVAGVDTTTGLASNYNITNPTGLVADITAKDVTVNATANNKTYDGDAVAALTNITFNGLIGSEALDLSGQFSDQNAAANKGVTVAGVDTTTGLASNYNITNPTGLVADITAKDVTVNANANNKTYDGNTAAALTNITFNGLIGSEALDLSGQFSDQNAAANKGVTVAGIDTTTGLASNYNITNPTGLVADITAKDVTVNANANNKTYDGNTVAALTDITFSGLIGTEALDLSGQFSDQNAATNKGVTVAGVDTTTGLASNYNITNPTGLTADITAKDVTVNATANNKTYDGDDVAALTNITFNGLIGSEALDLSGQFSDQNAENGKTVTVTGVDTITGLASNYNITNPTDFTADITALPVAQSPVEPAAAGSANYLSSVSTKPPMLSLSLPIVVTNTVSAEPTPTTGNESGSNANDGNTSGGNAAEDSLSGVASADKMETTAMFGLNANLDIQDGGIMLQDNNIESAQ